VSSNAHRGDDDIAFYAADIGDTALLSASVTPAQLSDAHGPLPSGRYIIQVVNLSGTGKQLVWVGQGPFVPGGVMAIAAAPGKDRIPLSQQALVAIETNVVKGFSDRIAAVTSGGTAEVYITRVSREAQHKRI
jgi:hypothetical protein